MCDTVIPSTYCARLLYVCYVRYCYTKYLLCQTVVCILCDILLYQVLIVPDCCMYIMCDTVISSTYCARLLYDCILCVILLYQVLIVPDCCMIVYYV